MKTKILQNIFIQLRKTTPILLATLLCCGLLPVAQAQIRFAEYPGDGRTPSSPSTIADPLGTGPDRQVQPETFIRGNDDHIYVNALQQTGYTGWLEVQGGGQTISEPEAVVFNSAVRLYVRGGDNRIYQNVHTGPVNPPETGWSGWHEVVGGGLTLSAPAAVIDANGRLNLFIRGLNSRIFRNILVNGRFGSWQEVPGGGLTISRPEAVVHNGLLKLYVRGIDNSIAENVLINGTWRGWQPVAGQGLTLAGPTAVVHAGTLKLFVTGINDGLAENDFPFNGWTSISSDALTPSAPCAFEFLGATFLDFRGEDGRIFNAGF
jgi:hypothetical protein